MDKVTERNIVLDLIASNMQKPYAIARQHGVGASSVQNIRRKLLGTNSPADKNPPVYAGGKNEPYYETEEQMLQGLPEYTATNRHLITPINKNWKLWQD